MKVITGVQTHSNLTAQLFEAGFINNMSDWAYETAYELTIDEIEHLEKMSSELHQQCMDLVASEVKKGDYQDYNFTQEQKEKIESSWKLDDPELLGRFSFNFDGQNFKLLKYNSNDLNRLLDSSIIQAKWLENINISSTQDQFNWIHQALLNRLSYLKEFFNNEILYVNTSDNSEDFFYLKDVISLANWEITSNQLNSAIQLSYETENILPTFRSIEPAWKLLLNHKSFLIKLAQLQSDNPVFSLLHENKSPYKQDIILSTWLVGETPCGIAIEEQKLGAIKFIPHYFNN